IYLLTIIFAIKHKDMLQISYIRENKEKVLEALDKRGFKELGKIDELIALDEQKRSIQSESDNLAAQANTAARQIGELMRQGKRDEAEAIKQSSVNFKEQIKSLSEQLNKIEEDFHNLLVTIP